MSVRSIAFLFALAAPVHAGPAVSFGPLEQEGERILARTVSVRQGRIATIAVVDANPADVRMAKGANGQEGTALKVLMHDPVSRLTFLKIPEDAPVSEAVTRGSALALKAGAPLYLDPVERDEPSRLVKWETQHRDKVLPLALIRVHHPGTVPPVPGSPLFNEAGEVVALCHEAAPEFGNGTYALPVEVVSRAEKDEQARGKVARCWIGITMEAKNPLPFVEAVRPESPAARAGLQKGDILLSIGERGVNSYPDAVNAFYYLVSGEETTVSLLRGTERLSFKVVPEVHPAEVQQPPPGGND